MIPPVARHPGTEPLHSVIAAIAETHPLASRYVVKGSAALHLFHGLKRRPRDLDLVHVESPDWRGSLRERAAIETALEEACVRAGWRVEDVPVHPLGGAWRIAAPGEAFVLDVDYGRSRLLLPSVRQRAPGTRLEIAALDPHELAAQKMWAVVNRARLEDFYDLAALENAPLEARLVRALFITQGALEHIPLNSLAPCQILRRLVPSEAFLRQLPGDERRAAANAGWTDLLLLRCERVLGWALPARPDELRFARAVHLGLIDELPAGYPDLAPRLRALFVTRGTR